MTTCSVMRGTSALAARTAFGYRDLKALSRRVRGKDGPLCCVSRLTGVSQRVPREVSD
ncbi:hypothetical protein [Paraburkholderia terricola]|uniref:Transposase n=1 Tax=Paraburkholderia terricola TaxID=169427 RepID=A0ABU1LSP3_9BURK|nr:hypothetical protein [Paraburkholderia terricola]MDR6409550.1 hypothetical protein [Paraburkholderia terricola]MDR6480438.1 hypothetical protein [Paraburkholderia terricola]